MRWKLLAIVGLLALAGGVVAVSLGAFRGGGAAATTFLTAAATVTDVTDEVTATGTAAATTTWDLAFGSTGGPAVAWPVTKVDVKVGDRVTSGQVLATASDTDLESKLADASRSAKVAALQLLQAQDGLDAASGTAAKRQARIGLYNAQSAKARADADLASVEALRGTNVLAAPADGIVTAVSIEAGVDAGSGAAVSLAAAALEVTTSVVESDVAKISLGQKATVSVSAISATLQGTVASIAPTASSSSGSGASNSVVSYGVEITLDAPPRALRPGMSADVSIVTATASNVLAIPSRALSGSAGAYTVRVVADDGSVAARSVSVGLVTSSLAEITSGLAAGERVVTGTSSTQLVTTQGGGTRGFFGGGGPVVVPGR